VPLRGRSGLDKVLGRTERADCGRWTKPVRESGRLEGIGGSGGNPPRGIGGGSEVSSFTRFAFSTMSRASALVADWRAEYRS
jgi:hypothetical protein